MIHAHTTAALIGPFLTDQGANTLSPRGCMNLEDKVLFQEWGNDSMGQTRPIRTTRKPKKLEDYVYNLDAKPNNYL